METPKGDSNETIIKSTKIKKYIDSLKILKEKLKQNIKREAILNSFESNNSDIKIYLNFFFFENLKKYIHSDINNKIEKNIILGNFYNSDKCINNISNLFEIIVKWIYYLYWELINNIYSPELYIISKNINQINFLFEQTFDIIIKLYNNSKNSFSTENIFDILYFILFLIDNNLFVNYDLGNFDKLYYTKNYVLLKNLFSFFGNVAYIILNKANINEKQYEEDIDFFDKNYKKEISIFFDFLKDLEENKEANYVLNKSIIFNNNFLDDLFTKKIFEKIDVNILEKYEKNYKKKLIDFYFNFAKFYYTQSKILTHILETLKNAFINLNDFNENQKLIYKDIFIQGFYTSLLKKLLFSENNSPNVNKNISPPLFASFLFNPYDSKIELNIYKHKFLENFSMFFSINLLPREPNIKFYHILTIEKDNNDALLNFNIIYNEKEKKKINMNIYFYLIK